MQIKWIKICTDIFDDEKILLIESLPEADSIIVIWFKLLTLAGKQNAGGVFLLNDRIAYTDEMLATIFRRPLNTVRLALQTFEHFDMVRIIDGAITIPNWNKHQSLEATSDRREYMKNYMKKRREQEKLTRLTSEEKIEVKKNLLTSEKNEKNKTFLSEQPKNSNEISELNDVNINSKLTLTHKNKNEKENKKEIDKEKKFVPDVNELERFNDSPSFLLENCFNRFGSTQHAEPAQENYFDADEEEIEAARERMNPKNDSKYAYEPTDVETYQPDDLNAMAADFDPFAPIHEQIQAVQDIHALDIADDESKIVSIPEAIGLARNFGIKLANTAKLREAIALNVLTVAMVKKCISIHKSAGVRPAAYLAGIMLNAAKNPNDFNGVRPEKQLNYNTISDAQAWKFAKSLSGVYAFTSKNARSGESMNEWVDRWTQKIKTPEGWQAAEPTLKKLELI